MNRTLIATTERSMKPCQIRQRRAFLRACQWRMRGKTVAEAAAKVGRSESWFYKMKAELRHDYAEVS